MKEKRGAGPRLSVEELLEMYRTMATIRAFEEQVRNMHLAGLVPGLVHLCTGQEAVAVGTCAALAADDYIASHHRGHGHCIAKGARLDRLFAELLGRRPGYGMGRGGSMHVLDPQTNNLGTTGIVGGGAPIATGAALSAKLRGSGQIAVSFFGDGALNQGLLFEAMNMAAVWSLPVVYICENNGYGEFTETDAVTAGHPYTKRGDAFDIPSVQIDGMDVLAVHQAAARAVQRARQGGGPSFVVCDTYRFSGHHVGDKAEYRDEAKRRAWEERDPIPTLARQLMRSRHATRASLGRIDKEAEEAVAVAAARAREMPEPQPDDFAEHVHAVGA